MKPFIAILFFAFYSMRSGYGGELPSVEKMPDLPQPFILRDWKKVAKDYDEIVFNFDRKGKNFPLIWNDHHRIANDVDGFAIPSFVGDFRQTKQSGGHEGITSLAAVLGSTLVGIDKSKYASMLPLHYHKKDGIGLYLNRVGTRGSSYWYDLLPGLLFYHIYPKYRDIPGFREQLVSSAEVWQNVFDAANGNFDHTGFDFIDKKPIKNSWSEPDVVAGIACLQYLAYTETKDDRFLHTAEAAMQWLDAREENPYYECLAAYGALISARSNAERDTDYQIKKQIEWVLAGDNPRKWGAMLEKWNNTEAFGLIGSVYPQYEYAFAMNSFQAVGIMAPIARYEERFARDLAKWILNVAVNARLFYPNAWPANQQSSYEWAVEHDPNFCIPYEGLRKQGTTRNYPENDQVSKGTLVPGNQDDLNKDFTLVADANGEIEYQGTVAIPGSGTHQLIALVSHRKQWNQKEVTVSLSDKATVTFREDNRPNIEIADIPLQHAEETSYRITIKAAGLEPSAKVKVDDILVETRFANPPHVGGDAIDHGWADTDLGLYGGSWVGLLAAIVEPTNVEGIIAIDPVATDMMPPETLPTRILFNPYDTRHKVEIENGEVIYNALSDQFLDSNTSVTIPAKEAVMLVYCPVDGEYVRRGNQLLCNGIVIDYQTNYTP